MIMQTVDLGALRENARTVKKILGGAKLCAMVKADGYGHGIAETARVLSGTADCFGVAAIGEGLLLKDRGITNDILVTSPPEEYAVRDGIERGLILTVADSVSLDMIARAARSIGKPARVHVKIDTGMRRLGISDRGQFGRILKRAVSSEFVSLEGIFTHYATADTGGYFFEHQYNEFKGFLKIAEKVLGAKAYGRLIKHGANSGAALRGAKYHMDMARAGLLLYGCLPAKDLAGSSMLRPVMSVTTGIAQLKRVKAGDAVGYGGTYICPKDALLAAVRIGYGDGYPRALSNRGYMAVRGTRCPIVGNACMDLTMIDVANVPDIGYNDTVEVLGGGISMEGLASRCGAIPYEIMTGFHGSRILRKYERNN